MTDQSISEDAVAAEESPDTTSMDGRRGPQQSDGEGICPLDDGPPGEWKPKSPSVTKDRDVEGGDRELTSWSHQNLGQITVVGAASTDSSGEALGLALVGPIANNVEADSEPMDRTAAYDRALSIMEDHQ